MEESLSTVEVEKYVKRAVYAVVILLAVLVAIIGGVALALIQWLVSK